MFLRFLLFPANQESRDNLLLSPADPFSKGQSDLNEDIQKLRSGFLKTLQCLPLQLEEIQIRNRGSKDPLLCTDLVGGRLLSGFAMVFLASLPSQMPFPIGCPSLAPPLPLHYEDNYFFGVS